MYMCHLYVICNTVPRAPDSESTYCMCTYTANPRCYNWSYDVHFVTVSDVEDVMYSYTYKNYVI